MQGVGDTTIEWIHCGQLLAERSAHAIALLTHPGHQVGYANPAFCRLVERDASELPGRPLAAVLDGASAGVVAALLAAVAAREAPECLPDVPSPGPGGPRYRTFLAWPIPGVSGPSGLVLQMSDTTEAVLARAREAEAAAELRQVNEHLVVAGVRERELARQAQEAVRARDIFLARASHELRTPLTSAFTTVRLLERVTVGTLRESPEELIRIALRNLDTMIVLIDNLLDASKLSAIQEPLALEPVPVGAAVARALDLVRPQAKDKRLELTVDIPAPLAVQGDPLRLEQVLVNLVGNSIKFTPAGGEVAVSAVQRPDGDRGEVLLRVRDSGDGIAPEHLERVFEPFFQVTREGRPRTRGTGLGLAICRQIVTLHGGGIWAESDGPGRGSTFVVRLPAAVVSDRAA